MKNLISILLVLAMLLALTACSTPEPPATEATEPPTTEAPTTEATEPETEPPEPGLVGISMPTKDLWRWKSDGEQMKAQLEELGYEVDLQYAANDIPTQVSQIENMIEGGCKVLVIASIDGDSLGTVLAQAKEAGIPVIAYDRLIMNSDAVTYYITFDNFDVGVKMGSYIEAALDLANAGDKTYNIEFADGDRGSEVFWDGAMSVLGKYIDAGTLVVVSGQKSFEEIATPGWATDKTQERFENILASFYADKPLDVVLAISDSLAQGVANALASTYHNDVYPIITGQDCDIVSVQNMIAGKQAMSVFKDTRDLAAKTVEMVNAIMQGLEPPINDTESYDNGAYVVPSYLVEPVVVTGDKWDIQSRLVDSGYYSAADLGL